MRLGKRHYLFLYGSYFRRDIPVALHDYKIPRAIKSEKHIQVFDCLFDVASFRGLSHVIKNSVNIYPSLLADAHPGLIFTFFGFKHLNIKPAEPESPDDITHPVGCLYLLDLFRAP